MTHQDLKEARARSDAWLGRDLNSVGLDVTAQVARARARRAKQLFKPGPLATSVRHFAESPAQPTRDSGEEHHGTGRISVWKVPFSGGPGTPYPVWCRSSLLLDTGATLFFFSEYPLGYPYLGASWTAAGNFTLLVDPGRLDGATIQVSSSYSETEDAIDIIWFAPEAAIGAFAGVIESAAPAHTELLDYGSPVTAQYRPPA